MTADPYIPDEAELIDCYAGLMEEQAGENYGRAKTDARRGIAKIKADALREAAGEVFDTMLPAECAHYLNERARRIGGGAPIFIHRPRMGSGRWSWYG